MGRRMDRVAAVLGAIDGVRTVAAPTRPDGPVVVTADGGHERAQIREADPRGVRREGLRLSSIREVLPSLDDIYRHALTEHGLAGQAAVA